jgi:hypothetical protein
VLRGQPLTRGWGKCCRSMRQRPGPLWQLNRMPPRTLPRCRK